MEIELMEMDVLMNAKYKMAGNVVVDLLQLLINAK